MPEAEEAVAVVDAQVNDEVDPKKGTTETEPSEPTKPEGAEPAKPGTPDKALQKMQQELGNVTRQIAALTEKKAEGELTDADKAKLAKAQDRIGKIRSFVGRPDRELEPSDVDSVAEHVLELDDRVGEVDQLRAELKDAKSQLAYLLNDHGWDKARAKYPGLDVDAIWDKAQNDAAETLADDATPRAVNRLASRWFEERCDAAKKRQGDEDPKKKKEPVPPNAPSSYKVGSAQRVAPVLSDEEDALAMARALVVEI